LLPQVPLQEFPEVVEVGVGVMVGVAVGVVVGVVVGVKVGVGAIVAACSETFCCCLTNKTPATTLKIKNTTIATPTITPVFPAFLDLPEVIISKGED
jgi:hypothetical protein